MLILMNIDNLDNAIYKILLDIIIKHKEYIKYNIENDFIDNLAKNLSILISSRLKRELSVKKNQKLLTN